MTKGSLQSVAHSSNNYHSYLYAIHDTVDRLSSDCILDTDLIEQSTALLDELDEARAALLATRAQAFWRKGAFDQAIEDASKVVEVRPASVQGYLVLGEVYATQGRHQLAISVLEDGLRCVLPSGWPLLYEKREASLQSFKIKVDFVRILPPEINTRIFSFLSNNDDNVLVSCTLVSKYWRSAILGCSDLWEVAEFGVVDSNGTASLLHTVSTYVKKLTFYPSRSTKEHDFILELATESMLPRVEELVTEACLFSERREHEVNVGVLVLLGKQLTELTLCSVNWSNQNEHNSPISLSSILIQCPNLKHLYLKFPYSPSNLIHFGSSELSGPLNLETVFSSFRGNDDIEILEQLIPRCPSLLYLHTRSPEPRILSLLGQHCPNLKQLHMWSLFFFSPPKVSGMERQSTSGLKKIYCEVSNASQMENLAPFLVKSKDSLDTLHLRLVQSPSTMMITNYSLALPDIEYDQLKEVHCHAQKFDNGISKIMRQCPVLDSILLNVPDTVPVDFFLSLAYLPHLRRLNIETIRSCGGLEHFFAYHSALDQESTLEGVQIQGCEAITDEVLYALAGVMTLQTVVIRGRFPLTTPEGMSEFVRKLGANANLKFLLMQDIFLENDSIEGLESIIGLKVKRTPDEESNCYQLGDVHDHYFDYY